MGDSISFKRIEDPRQIEKIRALERELGAVVVVLEPQYRPAVLTNDQLKQVAELERELSVVLVAYVPTVAVHAAVLDEGSNLDEGD
jgi:hypothetical protein